MTVQNLYLRGQNSRPGKPREDLASFIRRSDRCECHASVNGRVDGGIFRDVENALEVGDLGSSGIIGRTGHGPVAVRLPMSAISMAACG